MSNIKASIETYFSIAAEIHEYFGYNENWKCIPMDNHIGDYWMVFLDKDEVGGKYVYSPKPFTEDKIKAGSDIYSGEIYCQRFLKKWVYRAKDMTMICADTQTDGNKFLMLFENDKECKDDYLKKVYLERWGTI